MEANTIEIIKENNDIKLIGFANKMSLSQTLDCGQAFRWKPIENENKYCGVVKNKYLVISSIKDDIILHNTTIEEYNSIWKEYFDIDRDYEQLKETFSTDTILKEAIGYAPNIRILSQEPWETVCSFIISSNNNIKRIKGIIERMCEMFGEEIEENIYMFPTAEKIASLKIEDLEPLRAGYRNKFILDCAQKIASGEVDLENVKTLDTVSARKELMKIKGIGQKVADCALLFSFTRMECFPMDTWMKKVTNQLYPNGLPTEFVPYGGIAQQYLFHYARNHSEIFEK